MAGIDDIILELKQALNRPTMMDGTGADITAAIFPLWVNQGIHALERRLFTPFQTYTYTLTFITGQQTYPLQPGGALGPYRSTRGITIPWQATLTTQGEGVRVNYLPMENAREKWQLPQFAAGNTTGTGVPLDYSIFYDPVIVQGPAYYFWPTPGGGYTCNIDQGVFLPDLVAGQMVQQTNWFTLNLSDLVLYESAIIACRVLKDVAGVKLYTSMRDETFASGAIAVAELFIGEQGTPAGMIEMG